MWKPLEGSRGERELHFYEEMESRKLEFMARYHGVQEVEGVQHLLMEDVRMGMDKPCVMDLKTGKHCYTPWHGALFPSLNCCPH